LAGALLLAGCGRIWLPQSVERGAGARAAHEILQRSPSLPGHPWSAFVSDAGRKLAAVSERPDYGYTFTIVSSPEINAYSTPDGEIFLTDGLIAATDGDQEAVAAVLGHELGHVARRHGAEALQSRFGVAAALMALFGFDGHEASKVGTAAFELADLGYGREMELEADLCAIRYMTRLGYPPEAGLKFLRILAAREDAHGAGLERYLSSHPPTDERLNYAEAYAAKLSSAQ
jgi:predicted Zn-dependent protease